MVICSVILRYYVLELSNLAPQGFHRKIQSGCISKRHIILEANMRANTVKILAITYTKSLAHWILHIQKTYHIGFDILNKVHNIGDNGKFVPSHKASTVVYLDLHLQSKLHHKSRL